MRKMDPENIKSYLRMINRKIDHEKLLKDPNIDMPHEEFKKIKRSELNAEIKSIKKVYLDQKYWINIRKNIFNESNKEKIYLDIFNKLKQLVEDKKIICPISQIGFFELLKQKYSRNKTAQMIDILSNGIATNHLNEIKKAELFNLIHKEFKGKLLVHDYVWNNAICVIGEPTIKFNSQNEQNSRMANYFYKIFQNIDFQFMVSQDGMFCNDSSVEETLSKKLNQITSTSEGKRTFKEIQNRELLSTLYTLSELVELKTEFEYEEFKLLSSVDEINKIIPSLKIFSSIHSFFSFNNQRKYKTNDFDDIEHSCIGVGYSDYFFTENSFAQLLKSKHLNFENEFNVIIESNPNIVYEILSKIK